MKKCDREIMEILDSYDLTRCAHSAAELAGCDAKTLHRRRYGRMWPPGATRIVTVMASQEVAFVLESIDVDELVALRDELYLPDHVRRAWANGLGERRGIELPGSHLEKLSPGATDEGSQRVVAGQLVENVTDGGNAPATAREVQHHGRHEVRVVVEDREEEVGRRLDRDVSRGDVAG